MTNTREQNPEEQRRQLQSELTPVDLTLQAISELDHRHYAPIQNTLLNEAAGYEWRRETGDIQSYQHNQTGGWLHIDPQGQFYDRQAQPIARDTALDHANHLVGRAVADHTQMQSSGLGIANSDQGLGL